MQAALFIYLFFSLLILRLMMMIMIMMIIMMIMITAMIMIVSKLCALFSSYHIFFAETAILKDFETLDKSKRWPDLKSKDHRNWKAIQSLKEDKGDAMPLS